jgi:hypothetical protein
MSGRDLVVAESADDEERPHVGMGHQVLEQREAGRIGPLQIVDEEREGALLVGEHPDEAPEHEAEPSLRLGRRQLGNGRLRADEELQLGDHVHHEPCVGAQRWPESLTPVANPLLALQEHVQHQLPEGLHDRGIGDVALVLVELAFDEEPLAPLRRPRDASGVMVRFSTETRP